MISNFKSNVWTGLNPKVRRAVVVTGICGALFALVYLFQPDERTRSARNNASGVIENVLTDKNTRTVSLDSMAARIELLEDGLSEKERQIERLQNEISRREREPAAAPAFDPAFELQIAELQRRVGELQQQVANPPKPAEEEGSRPDGTAADQTAEVSERSPNTRSPIQQVGAYNRPPTAAEFYQGTVPAIAQSTQDPAASSGGDSTPRAAADIRVVFEEAEVAQAPTESTETIQTYLPSGSIFSGTLITGMDAPTGNNARQEPFPALLRVKKDAILPNRYRADVRECFLLMAGYGDLSSERAYLRGETISCVTHDQRILEAQFPAYAVGEDGKAGVRGRLVSKQGQVIGRALMAGFLDGVSKAFDVRPVPVLETNNTGESQYADVFAGRESLQAAAFGGASTALDRIAQFYIDMAANIFPVIEVDAGRQIDMIATRGINLVFRSRSVDDAPQNLQEPGRPGSFG